MLKQLIEDVKFEACRRSYLEKVGKLGQRDIELSLLGYHLISPAKILDFLERNAVKIAGVDEGKDVFRNSGVESKEAIDWLNGSIGRNFRITGHEGYEWYLICLREVAIETFDRLIPEECLERVLVAKETGMFDYFTVAYPEGKKVTSDPVVFGRRTGSPNRFYICQWDNDVTLDDLL